MRTPSCTRGLMHPSHPVKILGPNPGTVSPLDVTMLHSSKQLIVTLSPTESEYVALFACATEVVFLRRLLQELGFDQGPAIVF